MTSNHDETPREALERMLTMAERRQKQQLWDPVGPFMRGLVEDDPETALGLMHSVLEPDVRKPCSLLWLKTKGGTEPKPRPEWDVEGTASKFVITRVNGRNSTEARAAAGDRWRKRGVKFSPKNRGTRRADDDSPPRLPGVD